VFGDINRAYTIRRVNGFSLQRQNELYSNNGQVGFRGFERVDGRVVNADAVRVLQHSATSRPVVKQRKEEHSDGRPEEGNIKEGEVVGAPVVASTTEATPSPADETSMPNHLNTEHEQPPVRSSRPDVPLAQTLTAGAGEHTPPDPKVWGPDGRLIDNPADDASAKSSK
jgi:hypothetical protein